jgi:hypothetical protein
MGVILTRSATEKGGNPMTFSLIFTMGQKYMKEYQAGDLRDKLD